MPDRYVQHCRRTTSALERAVATSPRRSTAGPTAVALTAPGAIPRVPPRLPAAGRAGRRARLEAGFGLIDALIAASLVVLVIVAIGAIFGQSHQKTTAEVNAQGLQDVGATIGVDAQAIGAYDPSAQAAFKGLSQQHTTITVNGQTTTVKVNGTPLGMGVSISSVDGSSANLVAPLPEPKATPE